MGVILVSQELEVWDLQVEQDHGDPLDPLGIVNSVTVLLPRQTNRPIKKALKLITIPGQALIGPARTAQLPMLQGRLPRICRGRGNPTGGKATPSTMIIINIICFVLSTTTM